MSNYIFLYRVKDSNDRDCCKYIEDEFPRFECNHYFGGLTLHGSCFSGSDWDDYEDIETVLTEEEYEALKKYNEAISDLGYGIEKGDDRYKEGIRLSNSIKNIINKLHSKEAKSFQDNIISSEIECLKEEYNLSDEDIEDIFSEYYLDYRDRSIVGYVFNDTYDVGYEEAFSLGIIDHNDDLTSRYFDFEKFGEDLIDEENYMQLRDGRVVSLMY